MSEAPLKIAVVGAGVAGISSAYILSQKHNVTLFEKNTRLGGHTHTIVIDKGRDAGLAVDTGFIVCNDKTYPNFHRFLASLGVPWRWSNMSFSYWNEKTNFQYAGTDINGLFAQRMNAVRPTFWKMLYEIRRFSKQALSDLTDEGNLAALTLGQYLKKHRFDKVLIENYVVPMGAAIWSTGAKKMLEFPARTFLTFFRNHGLLAFEDRPRWQTVVGGSHSYLHAFEKQFNGEVRLGFSPRTIARNEHGIEIVDHEGHRERFDRVVIATHADQALKLLEKPSEAEREILGPWGYEKNRVVLHTDRSVLPPLKRAWASWNYVKERGRAVGGKLSMTYYMNMLQGIRSQNHYCVTLNREQPIDDRYVIRDLVYTHPLYTKASIAAQARLGELQGKLNTHYAGSYFGYGFHEDAVRSGVLVGRDYGLDIPHGRPNRDSALQFQGASAR